MYVAFDEPDILPPYNKHRNDAYGDFGDIILISFITMVSMVGLFIISGMIYIVIRRSHALSDDEIAREEENQAYLELNSDEQELYFQSKEFLQSNPYYVGELTLSQNLSIQEKGINAFEFTKDAMLTNNDLLIVNKTELNFFKSFECSTQTNLPIPMKNEVYYYECKIYSLANPQETLIAMGLSIKPYPWFRLPGRHPHSVTYDSNGYRRYNQPFNLDSEPAPFPTVAEGDVIGVGYRTRSGTIFFTRNGKKVSESKLGGHVKNFKIANQGQIFPTVGANNICSVHVNLGQRGFVFIEANVKNWGYAPIEGNGPAPPAYNKFNSDILLERSEAGDDDDECQDLEDDFPPDFWATVKVINGGANDEGDDDDVKGKLEENASLDHDKFSYNAYSEVNSNDERITLNSLAPPNKPPSYNDEHDLDEAGEGEEQAQEGEDEEEGEEQAQEGEDEEDDDTVGNSSPQIGPSPHSPVLSPGTEDTDLPATDTTKTLSSPAREDDNGNKDWESN
ncbi:uncharacterized protein LODBEIA_P48900 [Lodderomyces beijingensis]|uniref:B30.2/SPRY domain-containing protein n=1 Tax=Lodderomyces beijingensis TaxID=1775926 RepID=A0ABP0ZUJ8_9ASCO